jgi:hypothetical protein
MKKLRLREIKELLRAHSQELAEEENSSSFAQLESLSVHPTDQ